MDEVCERAYLPRLLVELSQGKLDWFEPWKMNRLLSCCVLWHGLLLVPKPTHWIGGSQSLASGLAGS